MSNLVSDQNSRIKLLGVINITPNSFSDGGQFFDLPSLQDKIKNDLSLGFRCLDFGAESTAPKNKNTVNAETELLRLKNLFLPILDELKELEVISLDTYRFDNFFFCYHAIRSLYPTKTIFWNDVSGVIDADLEQFIQLLKETEDKNVFYVASFTFVTKREFASHHMDFVKPFGPKEEIINDYMSFVEKFSTFFLKHSLKDQLILDPAFGFSKSYEENFELLNSFLHHPKFFKFNFLHANSVMIGISKKSFLRRYVVENDLVIQQKNTALSLDDPKVYEIAEELHFSYLKELGRSFHEISLSLKDNQHLFLRTHAYFSL